MPTAGWRAFTAAGAALEGRLDQALAGAGRARAAPRTALPMGFVRLHGGRTTVIVDAAPPPTGRASANAPCLDPGDGADIGAPPADRQLRLGRQPSGRNGAARGAPRHRIRRWAFAAIPRRAWRRRGADRRRRRACFTDAPDEVWAQIELATRGARLIFGHNGYVATHGLTHVRELELTLDGRVLAGEDTLGAMTAADRKRFETIMERTRNIRASNFDIRFHLHPEVDAALDLGGTAVSLALKSGEIWIFRHDGVGEMVLEPSVYLESGRLQPRAHAARSCFRRAGDRLRLPDRAGPWRRRKIPPSAIRDDRLSDDHVQRPTVRRT